VASLSTEGRTRLDRLMPLIIDECASIPRSSNNLGEVIRLLEAIGRRSTYFAALIEYPIARTQVIDLCAASPWLAGWLGGNPLLLDELLSPVDNESIDRDTTGSALDKALAETDPDDVEALMHRLREFRHSQVFGVATRQLRQQLSGRTSAMELTVIAESVLDRVREIAIELSRDRMPDSIRDDLRFAIVAYGKLGSLELGYTSDVDIIFVYDDFGEYSDDLAAGYARIAQRVISLLTTRLSSGLLYEVDVRLRPSGRKGLLVSSLASFERYQSNDAWTWEHQALVRARAISGTASVCEQFDKIRHDVLTTERDTGQLITDVDDMRKRMTDANDKSTPDELDLKLGRGALVDIEFLTQFGVLSLAAEKPGLTKTTQTISLLEQLGDAELFTAAEVTKLSKAFDAYLTEINRLRMMELPALTSDPQLLAHARDVQDVWRRVLPGHRR